MILKTQFALSVLVACTLRWFYFPSDFQIFMLCNLECIDILRFSPEGDCESTE